MEAAAAVASNWRTEEVRVAMALNGGVSLAVWMGGCAVELDCARRAHLGPESLAPAGKPANEPPDRSVYAAICLAFDRQLVVDLMSGASAGGINGALLAAAIHGNTRLHPDFLRERWLDLGDFSNLLHKTSNAEPRSLMQGQLFHDAMEKAFKALLQEPGAESADLVALPANQTTIEPLDAKLDVTATNVFGEERRYADRWGQQLVARQYRARFKFRKPADFTWDSLAQAARSSASFPIAFEPWKVTGAEPLQLAGFPFERYAIDGGLLDNAPVRAVLQLIPERPAARQVQRFVCYVNADPPQPEKGPTYIPKEPTIQDVIGYVINLPRQAPFVDELDAIQHAVRRSRFATETRKALIAVDIDSLSATAQTLLTPYRRRRRILALEDFLDDPAAVDAAFRHVEASDSELPWIPTGLEPPATPAEWRWGIRVAMRIMHLVLDLIREAFAGAAPNPMEREGVLAARGEIEALLAGLQAQLDAMSVDPVIRAAVGKLASESDISAELAALQEQATDFIGPTFEAVRSAAAVALGISQQLGDLEPGKAVAEALFGPTWAGAKELTAEMFAFFLRRTLAMEVVRRAFFTEEAVETGQEIHFAQLTPFAPSPIFTRTPVREPGPDTPDEKLTGTKLSHFSGFYRYSWRANDFMWGRLDAATRIVQLLVRANRAQWVSDIDNDLPDPWAVLAQQLAGDDASAEQLWLLHETLVDARAHGPDVVQAALEPYDFAEQPSAGQLRPHLQNALEADLSEAAGGVLARLVCTRAAQLEIVRQELPHVAEQSLRDRRLGTLSKPLKLPEEGGIRAAIERVRGESLPERLGRDSKDELASNLAVRTVTHAALVGVGAIRAARLPLAQLLGVVRAPLLPAAGMVARSYWNRLGVVAGFAAAVSLLVARILTTDRTEHGRVTQLFSIPAAIAAIALLVIVGVVFLPLFRAWRGTNKWRRVRDGAWGVALALGPLAAIVLGLWIGNIGWAELVAAPDAVHPNGKVSVLVLSAVVGIPLLRGVGLPRGFQSRLNKYLVRPWGGFVSLALIAGASAFLIYESAPKIWDAFSDGSGWRVATAIAAAISSAACALYVTVRR
jgi:patatin-related protein